MSYHTDWILTYAILESHEKDIEKFIQDCRNAGIVVPEGVSSSNKNLETDIEAYLNSSEYGDYDSISDIVSGEVESSWTEQSQDMVCLSRQFPTVLFTLEARGREAGDIWREYYLDGLCQHTKATFTLEAFDKEKLE